jgi:hypothetical protein
LVGETVRGFAEAVYLTPKIGLPDHKGSHVAGGGPGPIFYLLFAICYPGTSFWRIPAFPP